MLPTFLSYRRTWMTEVEELANALRRRGMRVFLDYSEPASLSGPAFSDALRRVIREECACMLLHATSDITSSAAIWNVEVPTALERADRDPDFFIVPFFRDIAPSKLAAAVPHGPRLAACNGILAATPAGAGSAAFLSEKRGEVVRLVLGRLLQGRNGSLSISLQTRAVEPENQGDGLLLDWQSVYPDDVPDRTACDDAQGALRDLMAVLGGKTSIRRLEINTKSHLSACVVFGNAFSQSTGFHLHIGQGPDVWSSGGPVQKADLRITAQQLDPGNRDICLIIAISRPETIGSAEKALAKLSIAYGGRIVVAPGAGSSRESVLSAGHARGIAKEVATTLMGARA